MHNPYTQGQFDRRQGVPREANPYPLLIDKRTPSSARTEWFQGWANG